MAGKGTVRNAAGEGDAVGATFDQGIEIIEPDSRASVVSLIDISPC